MNYLLIAVAIFSAYWIVSVNDENVKLKEAMAGETWCEVRHQASTSWQQCRVLSKEEINKQVATIN